LLLNRQWNKHRAGRGRNYAACSILEDGNSFPAKVIKITHNVVLMFIQFLFRLISY